MSSPVCLYGSIEVLPMKMSHMPAERHLSVPEQCLKFSRRVLP